jgi:hypothetical protein
VTRTITVTNVGSDDLLLTEPITLPAGFTLLQSFGETTLAAGASTTFVIQFDAASAGTFGGELSFGNNDADEGPFNFTISAAAAGSAIIDNGDAGFTTSGSGWGLSTGGGFEGDHSWNAAGTGADTAEWTFNVAPGTYEVAVTWIAAINRATNAPLSVLDGTTVLATIAVNQELTPGDFTADGASWKLLGEFTITSGTLTVRLSDSANQFVIADAVRIAPVASATSLEVGVPETVDGETTGRWDHGNHEWTTPPGHDVRDSVHSIIDDWQDGLGEFLDEESSSLGRRIAEELRNRRDR